MKMYLNDRHIFDSIKIENYPKNTQKEINKFYAMCIEYFKTGDVGFLKLSISISLILAKKSALFEQISLILSKHYMQIYKRI